MCDTPEFAEEQKQALDLGERLRSQGGIAIKDRRYHFKTYPLCFVGSELVDWLVSKGVAPSRPIAVRIGQRLIDHHIIHHVCDDHGFKDEFLFYRFRCDEQKPPDGPAATALIAACNGVTAFGPLMKRKKNGTWNSKFCVLKANELRLYIFPAETSPTPSRVCILDDDTTVGPIPAKDLPANRFGFFLRTQEKTREWHAESARECDAWISALTDAGAKLGAAPEKPRDANSIFDFTCADIDLKETPLSLYRGQVALVVNVACE